MRSTSSLSSSMCFTRSPERELGTQNRRRTKMHRIPSWCVAVLAAFIVIVASLLSWTTLRKTEAEIAEARTEVAAMLRTADSSWNSHRQADQRSSTAAMFLAQVSGNPNAPFLLAQAATHLRGATLSMWAASGQDVPAEPPENIAKLEQKLRAGDLSAYEGVHIQDRRSEGPLNDPHLRACPRDR